MEQNHQPQVEVSNARIAATQLGFDGAAMFGTLQLQAQGFGVGFSGHVLHVEAQTQEQADYQTSFGMDYIAQVLRIVGVQHWESLKGQPVCIARYGDETRITVMHRNALRCLSLWCRCGALCFYCRGWLRLCAQLARYGAQQCNDLIQLLIRYRREPSLSPCGARLSLDDSYHY